ncbi:hypothetical protein M501DRAFT_975568 [Patellaria atrata CBS 101060]|uniref:DUF4385 domain-containing protein n=1 Tax=Patellaria atrata CBS 101060 TaxID=1346257 RepID=A0A9P4VMK8_9PEZI|nr:hypothetical protein M501DRAFT_975568 [Patellaria atrata CBS 101060]
MGSAIQSQHLRMSYRIGRGEQGVLTFEPYKSALLPLWRFRTLDIARRSSKDLWDRFEAYGKEGDFVGMDMCRKFIQMGMTRAKRYANHKGGRKYDKTSGQELKKSYEHRDAKEKLEASELFKAVWTRCQEDPVYKRLKGEFQTEQKEWDREQKLLNKEHDSR